MATEVKWIESKTPLDVAIKYFVEFYHSGFQDVEDAKKYYFEIIEQNGFNDIMNKSSKKMSYKSFIEKPILEGGLGSTNENFKILFHNNKDVLDKHFELWNNTNEITNE